MIASTNWKESVAPHEEQMFSEFAQKFSEFQKMKSVKFGKGRALHRKMILASHAQLTINQDIPQEAKRGIAAKAGVYNCLVRLSNGSPDMQKDKLPDVRGFAVKVLNQQGMGSLGVPVDVQDFLTINHEIFNASSAKEFIDVVLALSKSPLHLLTHMISRFGFISALKKIQILNKSFLGFAHEVFFTAAPIQWGEYAVKLRFKSCQPNTDSFDKSDLAQQFISSLKNHDLFYDLEIQFFIDETKTPIEVPTQYWDSPWIKVGSLKLTQQDIILDPKEIAKIEAMNFDPWQSLKEHKPLGEIMRARKIFYFNSQNNRKN